MYAAIKTGQNGYSAEQVADRAISIQDLIDELQQLIEDGAEPTSKVVMVGYGRGAVYEPVRTVESYEEEDDDEYDDGI